MKTLVNIDSSKIVAAIRTTTPVTTSGKIALENLRKFISNHTMSATNLLYTIRGLEACRGDFGLEKLISTCKGMVAMERLQVASTFELVQHENKGIFGAVGVEAENALSQLYQMNADKIMFAIHDGALDKYATDAEIRKLIAYANAAVADQMRTSNTKMNIAEKMNIYMLPVLNIAQIADARIVYIDGSLYSVAKSGKLSSVASLADYEIPSDVMSLFDLLQYVVSVTDEPNKMKLAPDYAAVAEKYLGIASLTFDLLADFDHAVEINGQQMSFDKAEAVMTANQQQFLAASYYKNDAQQVLEIINRCIKTLSAYRGALLDNTYANVIAFDNYKYLVMRFGSAYTLLVKNNGYVVDNKLYNTAIDLLRNDFISNNPEAFNLLQNQYANELQIESSKVSIKVKLAQDLTEERKNYAILLQNITEQEKTLEELGSDANPDKVKELKDLHGKVTEAIDKIDKELEDLDK